MSTDPPRTTDFGFQEVPWSDKARRVRGVFDSVVDRYDLMNDLMSGGAHRLWKRFALELTGIRPGSRALDVAGGTGDIAAGLARQVGPQGSVVVVDINARMLQRGRDRLIERGLLSQVQYLQANAERLPFADASFDCITIGFGLRNVTDKTAALADMHRVLRPGGQLLVLEFSRPTLPALARAYELYCLAFLPQLGRLVTGDGDAYRYLAESIQRHPDQNTLLQMMTAAGFVSCRYHNLSGGIVALHRGYRC
jgi:demethylmenaquinone methyltransferase / 2-methoxy-6-polyprenyl-1,4-benzoquinol methylase